MKKIKNILLKNTYSIATIIIMVIIFLFGINFQNSNYYYVNADLGGSGTGSNISNLQAESGSGLIILSWTNPSDINMDGVLILQDTNPITTDTTNGINYILGQNIGTSEIIYNGTGTGHIAMGLINGTTYYYTIYTYDETGYIYESGVEYEYIQSIDTESPSIPQNLTGSDISQTEIDISWDASTDNVGVSGYKIFRDSVEVGTTTGTGISFTDTELTVGTQYNYTVLAYDAVDNEGTPSNSISLTTDGVIAASASRTTGVAPLSVFFNADLYESTPTEDRFHSLEYSWDFGDPLSGDWGTDNTSKNTDKGPVSSHVFEIPGTYTVILTIKDSATNTIDTKTFTITVTDPDIIFSGTNTTCISDLINNNFDGCPVGANHVSTDDITNIGVYAESGERLLFHRGSNWSVEVGTLGFKTTNGEPVQLGAYGSCVTPNAQGICSNAPSVLLTDINNTDKSFIDLNRKHNWRISDISFDGNNYTTFAVAWGTIDIRDNLFLRIKATETHHTLIGWDTWRDFESHLNDNNAIVDSELYGGDGWCIYAASSRLAVLGNLLYDSTDSHIVRLPWAYLNNIGHNILSGAGYVAGSGQHAFKIHGPAKNKVGAYTTQRSLPFRTSFNIVHNNVVGGSGPMPVAIATKDSGSEENLADLIFEKNKVLADYRLQRSATAVKVVYISARYASIRNNIIDMSGGNDFGMIGIDLTRRGIEWTPIGAKIYNNVIYSSDSITGILRGIRVHADATDSIVKNNLVSFPNETSEVLIEDNSNVSLISNNLLTDNADFVDPNNVNPLLRNFHLTALSTGSINRGTSVSVFDDFEGNARPKGGDYDIGAYEFAAFSDTEDPSIPQNLNLSNITQTGATITWNASTDNTGVTGYRIFRDSVEVGTSTGTIFSNTGLTVWTQYDFTVSAYDAVGNESIESNTLSLTTLNIGTFECNDGIDNDGDGLIDWQFDLGCSGPEDEEAVQAREDEDGWTTYDPHPTETQIIYVSNGVGDDTYNGFAPEWNGTDGPKKTLAAATSLVRDNKADWVLLKRGDTWKDESLGGWEKSGISLDYPIILSTYGNSTKRPLIECSSSCFSSRYQREAENISILGIEFYAYKKDPNNPEFNGDSSGFSWLSYGGNFLVEDNFLNFIQLNIQIANRGEVAVRNNVIAHAYSSAGSHSQSMFTSVSVPLLIENNILYHGGWNDDFRIILRNPQTDYNLWKTVTDGRFDIELENNNFSIDNVNFSGVNNMNDVAQILETAINNKTGIVDGVDVVFTLGGVFKISSDLYKSSNNYNIITYSGVNPGTNIDDINWLNALELGVPESTIFNRNMYLSHGMGNTTVRNNIDAMGASGGTQLRMGGIMDNNLFLYNPISITFGSTQNDAKDTGGVISNNVILGSRNIDTQLQGTGIGIYSNLVDGVYGPSLIRDLDVYNNLIAHGTSVTKYNIKGIHVGGDAPHINLDIHDNVIYNRTNPSWADVDDHRAFGFIIGELNPTTSNSFFRNNIIQQVSSGFVGSSPSNPEITIEDNIYYSSEPNPPTAYSNGWFNIDGMASESSISWFTETNDTGSVLQQYNFTDASRDIETYNQSIGGSASFDDFISNAMLQSRFNWNKNYTTTVINNWVREGYDMPLVGNICTPSWQTGSWSSWSTCSNNSQTRTRNVNDLNSCGINTGAPDAAENQTCTVQSSSSSGGAGGSSSGGGGGGGGGGSSNTKYIKKTVKKYLSSFKKTKKLDHLKELKQNREKIKKQRKEMIEKYSKIGKKILTKKQKILLEGYFEEYNKTKAEISLKLEAKNLSVKQKILHYNKLKRNEKKLYYDIKNGLKMEDIYLEFKNEERIMKKYNGELRNRNKELRELIRGKYELKVNKYKKYYEKKLGSKLGKIIEKKPKFIEGIILKADELILKFEENQKINQVKKERLISKLISIKEIIEEKIEEIELVKEKYLSEDFVF